MAGSVHDFRVVTGAGRGKAAPCGARHTASPFRSERLRRLRAEVGELKIRVKLCLRDTICRHATRTRDDAAAALDVAPSRFDHLVDVRHAAAVPAHALPVLCETFGDYAPLDLLEAEAGRVAVTLPEPGTPAADLFDAAADSTGSWGRTLETVKFVRSPMSAGGRTVTREEWELVRDAAMGHVRDVLGLLEVLRPRDGAGGEE